MCWTSVIRHRVRPKLLWTEPLLWLTVPKGHHRFFRCWRPVSVAPSIRLVALDSGRRALDTAWSSSKLRQGSESSGERIWSLGGRSMYRHRALPATLPRARVCFRLAARPRAPRLQMSHTILTQAEWCAIRAVARCELGLPPSHQDHGGRSSSVLALIGVWNAVLRCTSGLAKETTFRSDGPCWSPPSSDSKDKTSVRAQWTVFCRTTSSPQQPFH